MGHSEEDVTSCEGGNFSQTTTLKNIAVIRQVESRCERLKIFSTGIHCQPKEKPWVRAPVRRGKDSTQLGNYHIGGDKEENSLGRTRRNLPNIDGKVIPLQDFREKIARLAGGKNVRRACKEGGRMEADFGNKSNGLTRF